MMSVGIVNDLATARRVLRSVVEQTPGFRVVWEAADGRIAVERHRAQPADIVLLDLMMPGLDGVQTTPLLMAVRACAILIVTATVSGHRQMVFAAMGKGALDAVDTPTMHSPAMVDQLRRKLITISRLARQTSAPPVTPPERAETPWQTNRAGATAIVAIGASTGGPQAIATILRGLPQDLPAAVLVVQHLDRHFVGGLQHWLAAETALPVSLAAAGTLLRPGTVLLADTEDHMIVQRGNGSQPRIAYTQHPIDTPHRPCIDTLFQSLAALPGVPRMGILLTGMGRDGAEGLLALRASGGHTIAQDQGTSIVYGMPRAAMELGAADALPLYDIPAAITRWTADLPLSSP